MHKQIFLLLALNLISIQAQAGNGPIAIGQWPSTASEVCDYHGTSNLNGKLDIHTAFTRHSDLMNVHVLLKFTASVIGITKNFLYEEDADFDAQSGAMLEVRRNGRETGCVFQSGECASNLWDDIKINWGADTASNRLSTWRIQGTDGKAFAKKYPGFSKYWPQSMFGQPWFGDYYSSAPDIRRDLDISGFDNRLVTPLISSFFIGRFLDPAKDSSYTMLVHMVDDSGKDAAMTSVSQVTYEPTKTGSTILRTSISFGNLHSPKDKPSAMEVDNATKAVRKMNFSISHPYLGEVNGVINPVACH